MVSCIHIAVNFFLFVGASAASSTITKGPDRVEVSKATDSASLRLDAAEADMRFFSVFLSDFRVNMDSYTSYLGAHHKTMPQKVADYYHHVAELPQSADLEKDIAASFPFSQFRTFIADFPWYSTLLSSANESTMFLPEDFATEGASHGTKTTNVQPYSSSRSTSSLSSTKSHSHNGAMRGSDSSFPLQFFSIPLLVGMLL
ncbi:hypothetical protein ZYGR_0A03810 [Zygosaccharomyces rouxii]|uniref:ZYRO0A08624p n=2 Tax=Zygosaccharomyces rouxii TaxID=4956 RepID=C5DQ49_ZYGRC|nr:uncharacterized protein ZYRO0A08624g [Zygosaccharomyces rouxii]GAV46785.1 hypothetical protein ZYGR_0A03810 [Zygosaccharomyces rouxii]CAR25810.1 ZYRO0A08624p [Zygosaccharomyces rouxii]